MDFESGLWTWNLTCQTSQIKCVMKGYVPNKGSAHNSPVINPHYSPLPYRGIQTGTKRHQPLQTLTSRCWRKKTVVTTFSWKPRDTNHLSGERPRDPGLDTESQQVTGKKGQGTNLLLSFPAFFLLLSMWPSWIFLIMIGKHLQNTHLQDGSDTVAVWVSSWWKSQEPDKPTGGSKVASQGAKVNTQNQSKIFSNRSLH